MGSVHRFRPRKKAESSGRPALQASVPLPEGPADASKPGSVRERLHGEIAALAGSPQIRAGAPASDDFRLHIARAAIALYLLEKIREIGATQSPSPAAAEKASQGIQSFLENAFFDMGADDLRDGYNALRIRMQGISKKLRITLLPPDAAVKACLPLLSKEIDAHNAGGR